MHYVVTRNSYPQGYPGLDERGTLLRKYVIPSLRNQTSQDFTWVLTSPLGLEGADLGDLDTVILDIPAPTDFNATTYLGQQLVSELAAELPKGEQVITTRLDNDDMLLPHYVEDLHELATTTAEPLLVDAPGFRVDTRFGKVYRDIHYADRRVPSPFVSVVEKKVWRTARLQTAFYDQHSMMHHHFPLAYMHRPGWVQLIHGGNKVMARSEDEVARRGELLHVAADLFLAAVAAGIQPSLDGDTGA